MPQSDERKPMITSEMQLFLTDTGKELLLPKPHQFVTAHFSDPKLEHKYRSTDARTLERMARAARAADATMMPFAQYSEQALLAGMFGNCCGCVRTTIAAAATAQTTINTGSIATGGASGNMDQTPNTTATVNIATPGTGATQNQYTAPHRFKLTGSAATSLTIASQSIGLAVTVGDFIFTDGSSSAGGAITNAGPCWMLNTLYFGLTTQAVSGATQANVLSGEPTSTGSYARVVVVNNQVNFPLPTAASPSVLTAGGPFSFPNSSAAWSTGATNLIQLFIADASTLAGGNVVAFGALGTPQAVNAANIQLSVSSSGLTVTLT
jgi:hypothetical protein